MRKQGDQSLNMREWITLQDIIFYHFQDNMQAPMINAT
jgi:hypothetical protein